jgi:hypothetical protein
MAEMFQDYDQGQPERPVFLTVLCILTFLGSGWGLVSGAIQYFTAEKQAQVLVAQKEKASADIQRKGKTDAGSQMAEKVINSMSVLTPDNIRKAGIGTALSAILCLAGAFMMWKLNKVGFYLYIAGTLVGVISPFLIYGNNNVMAIFSSVLIGFIGIVFAILYGVNVKHMR